MHLAIKAVRWFNDTCPWNQHKQSLTRWAKRRLPTAGGMQWFDDIHGGLKMGLDLAKVPDWRIYMHSYDVVMVQLLRRLLRPGDVYVDAGANLGLFTMLAARQVGPTGSVFAFEPVPSTFERLSEHVSRNELIHVTALPKACGSEPGEATIHLFADAPIGHASLAELDNKTVSQATKVEVVRIDDVVDRPAKFVKVDVEGAEWGAVKGAERVLTANARPHIVMEVNVGAAAAFGHHPMQVVDWILERRPTDRLHLLTSKRIKPTHRDELAKLIEGEPDKTRNVWFEPSA